MALQNKAGKKFTAKSKYEPNRVKTKLEPEERTRLPGDIAKGLTTRVETREQFDIRKAEEQAKREKPQDYDLQGPPAPTEEQLAQQQPSLEPEVEQSVAQHLAQGNLMGAFQTLLNKESFLERPISYTGRMDESGRPIGDTTIGEVALASAGAVGGIGAGGKVVNKADLIETIIKTRGGNYERLSKLPLKDLLKIYDPRGTQKTLPAAKEVASSAKRIIKDAKEYTQKRSIAKTAQRNGKTVEQVEKALKNRVYNKDLKSLAEGINWKMMGTGAFALALSGAGLYKGFKEVEVLYTWYGLDNIIGNSGIQSSKIADNLYWDKEKTIEDLDEAIREVEEIRDLAINTSEQLQGIQEKNFLIAKFAELQNSGTELTIEGIERDIKRLKEMKDLVSQPIEEETTL